MAHSIAEALKRQQNSLIVRLNGGFHTENRLGTVEQLFGYLTWRHSYALLVTFCTNKDMSRVVTTAAETMQSHQTFRSGSLVHEGPTRFRTAHKHPQDDAKQVEVFHLFVDLST